MNVAYTKKETRLNKNIDSNQTNQEDAKMTTAQLTKAFSDMTSKELKALCKAAHVANWWNLNKQQMSAELETLGNQLEAESVLQEPNVADQDPWQADATIEQPEQRSPELQAFIDSLERAISQPLLPAAATKKHGRKPKATKPLKADKSLKSLEKVTAQMLQIIDGQTSVTADSCSDPGRLVVKCTVLIAILEGMLNTSVSEKVFNQLVVLASRRLPRQPFTISSTGSRFKYLLMEKTETQPIPVAVQVLELILRNPQILQEARANYEVASETGLDAIQSYLKSAQ
jgi:hypothetical protein